MRFGRRFVTETIKPSGCRMAKFGSGTCNAHPCRRFDVTRRGSIIMNDDLRSARTAAPPRIFERGTKPEFVDDQQLVSGHLLLETKQAALVTGLHHLADQGRGCGEADGQSPLAGGQPEPQGDMGLAGAGRTSVILPGVWDLRHRSPIRIIRDAAISSVLSAPSGMRDVIISSSISRIGPWLCFRPGWSSRTHRRTSSSPIRAFRCTVWPNSTL